MRERIETYGSIEAADAALSERHKSGAGFCRERSRRNETPREESRAMRSQYPRIREVRHEEPEIQVELTDGTVIAVERGDAGEPNPWHVGAIADASIHTVSEVLDWIDLTPAP